MTDRKIEIQQDESGAIRTAGTDPMACSPVLADPDGMFETHYNRATFMFRHGLAGHPLLGLGGLIDLAKRLDKHNAAYWSNGPVGVADGWDKGTANRQSLVATIEHIEDNDSLVILKSVVHDPVLGPLMRDISTAIVDLVGPALGSDLTTARASILIASPRRVTAYHIDSDVNFLMQISGSKLFGVCDQTDRNVISHRELERYFAGDQNGAAFKEDKRNIATIYDLNAGFGVHVPCLAPHWAQNHDDVSVAISFNYDLRTIAKVAGLYRVNGRLRGFGLTPRAPGGTLGDTVKLALYQAIVAGRRLTRSDAAPADRSGWTPRLSPRSRPEERG